MNYPQSATSGDVINVNGIEIKIRNTLILNSDTNGEFYSIIAPPSNTVFYVDKDKIFDILLYNKNNENHILEWKTDTTKQFINAIMPNGKIINIINYLCEDFLLEGNRKFNYKIVHNNEPFNFRSNNLMQKNKSYLKKFKNIETPSKFFNDSQITILQNYSGHIKDTGQTAGIERNKYRLISVSLPNTDPKKYYEVFLNKKTDDGNEYSFIIDEQDIGILSSITVKNPFYNTNITEASNTETSELLDNNDGNDGNSENQINNSNTIIYNDNTIKQEYITIANPTWYIYVNQYIVFSYINIYSNQKIDKMIYLHRYLIQSQITANKNTVDHINGNKFDNRRCNLKASNMSEQNMNRGMVKRQQNLNTILNSYNRPDIDTPINLSFTNIQFITYMTEKCKNKNNTTEREYFTIELSAKRCEIKDNIDTTTTKSIINKDDKQLSLKIKLAQAICIRFLIIQKYPSIIKYQIDSKKFDNINEFLNHTEKLLTELLQTPTTVDAFLDYMASLKIPKYTDPRTTITTSNTSAASVDNPSTPSNDISKMKFDFLNYNSSRDKYDVCIIIGKDTSGKHIKYSASGCGSDNLSPEDKKAFALTARYNLFIDIENDLNKQLYHSSTPSAIPPGNTNINTTGLKSLTDFTLEDKTFKNFSELRIYTELLINQLLSQEPATQKYTLETFASYITKKADHKKINLAISKLAYDYPPLVKNNST